MVTDKVREQNMTFQDAKNQIAKKYGYDDWKSVDWYQLNALNETKPHERDAEDFLTEEAAILFKNHVPGPLNSEMPDYDELLLTVQNQKETIQELQKKHEALTAQYEYLGKERDYYYNLFEQERREKLELQKKYDALTTYVKERDLLYTKGIDPL